MVNVYGFCLRITLILLCVFGLRSVQWRSQDSEDARAQYGHTAPRHASHTPFSAWVWLVRLGRTLSSREVQKHGDVHDL